MLFLQLSWLGERIPLCCGIIIRPFVIGKSNGSFFQYFFTGLCKFFFFGFISVMGKTFSRTSGCFFSYRVIGSSYRLLAGRTTRYKKKKKPEGGLFFLSFSYVVETYCACISSFGTHTRVVLVCFFRQQWYYSAARGERKAFEKSYMKKGKKCLLK